jgi:hypothetical protein
VLNPLYSVVDTAARVSVATAHTDGYHLTIEGQSIKAHGSCEEIARLYPLRRGPAMPTKFKPRLQQSSIRLPTKGTSKAQATADAGWQLPAGNFLIGGRFSILDVQAALVPYLLTSYPSGSNSGHGWAVAINTSTNNLNVYLMTLGGTLGTAFPFVLDQPFWLFIHGDYNAGIVTAFMAMPLSQSGQLGPGDWVVFQIGAALNVTQWAQGDASPLFNVGNDNAGRAGVACTFDNVFMAQGASVPGIFSVGPGNDLQEMLEGVVYRGELPPGITALVRATENTGTTAASGVGGATMTITSGGWNAPGELVWPCDEDPSANPTAWATVAMADAAQVLPGSAFNATTIECTGALTADRNLQLPRRKGKVVTINNKTTGAHNVQAIGASGTGVNCAAGISRVYFDGTNFVAA